MLIRKIFFCNTYLLSLFFLSCAVQGRFKLKKAKANQNDSNPSAPSPSQSQASNPPSESQASNPHSQSQASNPQSQSESSKLGQGQEVDSKQEVEEEMPDLNDPEVQKATSFMQVANPNSFPVYKDQSKSRVFFFKFFKS